MSFTLNPTDQACGALVHGLDLSTELDADTIAGLRAAWLEHQVLVFPQQQLSDDDLERFTLYFGKFGDDPFIAPIEGRKHVIAVKREANEQAPVFAEAWHTDWSFQKTPPAGTCLYGIRIPPVGGDTLFINQQRALQNMPDELRAKLENLNALHSAKAAYAPDGVYGEPEKDSDRSMDIRPSEEAREVRAHPLIRKHPETGNEALFGCAGYIVGIEGMADAEAWELLSELYAWQTQEQFQYRHKWSEGMLIMWDNRSVLHSATSGYDGHARLLHRTTIADQPL